MTWRGLLVSNPQIVASDEVARAVADRRPVVALESTLIAHGLPRPDNARVARQVEGAVRAEGAIPATIAILDGAAHVGLSEEQLDRIASGRGVAKVSARDVAAAVVGGGMAATTVASTIRLARSAGIDVFATGGLGGVHREARETYDESGDLHELSSAGVVVVCAGVKSILDVPATLERLETLGVSIVGYQTNAFPGFYLADSGYAVDWRVEDPGQVAELVAARRSLGLDDRALIVANPLPEDVQLDPDLHDRVLEDGVEQLHEAGIRGKDVTPFLLDHFHRATAGASLMANIEIILRNAALAAQIAVAAVDRE